MFSLQGFDSNQHAPRRYFPPLPEGAYSATIVASERKLTRNRRGSYLQLTFRVIDGPFTDCRLVKRLNFDNPSAKAMEYARADLAAICQAIGVMTPTASTQLHDIPVTIHVRRIVRKDTGGIANDINGFANIQGLSPSEGSRHE